MLNPEQLQTLRDYLDANAGTYAGLSDQAAAETLNALTENRIKAALSGSEVWSVTDGGEFEAISDARKSQWLALCAIRSMDPANGTPAHALAVAIFSASPASVTLANLNALRQETVSPAATIGLSNITAEDVRLARLIQ